MQRYFVLFLSTLLIAVALTTLDGQTEQDRADLDAIYRIKDEGFRRSDVMEITAYLSDILGPRLTGSPNIKSAAEYALEKMRTWGLTNVKLEPWGPFAPGWTNDRFVALAVQPQPYPLIGFPKAWTPGTEGPVTGEAVMVNIETDEDFDKYRGKLRGKYVLTAAVADVPLLFSPLARRYAESDLAELAIAPTPGPFGRRPPRNLTFHRKRMQFFLKEEVAALLEPGRGSGGSFFIETGVASRDPRDAEVPAQVVLAVEHYNRIARMLGRKIPVTLEFDIRNTFYLDDLNSFTVVGEIAGTDKADELVMLGAHLDSWQAGTGATDNAAGVAMVLEAMRILKASGLKTRRTIRVGLWTGEEQGRLGSRAYVEQHFADPEKMVLKPEHARFSVYFNVDNGAGAIRGVYLQGNEAVAPIFRAWMDPFRNLGMTTLAIRDTGGTDHETFDAVGLPGFQFIQDPLEYSTRTHHYNTDVYDRIPAADMMQGSIIVASFAYHAANREARLPRKPLPKPQVPAGRGTAVTPSGRF